MDALSIGVSALNVFSKRLTSTSNNIANSQTNGYQASRVNLVEQAPGGVTGVVSRDLSPGGAVEQKEGRPGGGRMVEGSNVDLAREMTDLIVTKRAYQANAKVITTADETKGALLDIME